jgi:hypothetical protein
MTAATLPVSGLHVGFHKCASTTVQKALFDRHPGIMRFGKNKGDERGFQIFEDLKDALHSGHPAPGRYDGARARALWLELAETARRSGQVPLYSGEALTRFRYYTGPGDRRMPQALKALVGEARVIIIIRRQTDLLESLYHASMKPPDFEPFADWLAADRGTTPHMYKYSEIADGFVAAFGKDNVGVFLFEDLARDPPDFGRRIASFLGVDPEKGAELMTGRQENARPRQMLIRYSKLRQRLLPGVSFGKLLPEAGRKWVYRLLNRGGKPAGAIPADLRARLEDYYREDNRRLKALYGLAIERYGYPL